jgi:hypothetical protein
MLCVKCQYEFCWICEGLYLNYRHLNEEATKSCTLKLFVRSFNVCLVVGITVFTFSYKFNIRIGGLLHESYSLAVEVTRFAYSMRIVTFILEIIVQEAVLLSAFLQTNYLIVGFRISL